MIRSKPKRLPPREPTEEQHSMKLLKLGWEEISHAGGHLEAAVIAVRESGREDVANLILQRRATLLAMQAMIAALLPKDAWKGGGQ